ncbi:protease modulator HflC [Thalassoroseus pseudoceratinae]|uniref:protease modulator HflC n=1 Tax=Thalassoroseus pseudoceratinae TaxID=2713176 RepID=UPI00141E1A54|nr:protease modulator HflC [Thalassoroseus pseudoceratinae]
MRSPKVLVTGGIAAFVALILVMSSAFVVNERELAVILQFGKHVRSITEPGLYWKMPFTQEVRRLPSTLQFWQSADDIVDLPTADGKKIEVTAWALWKITDPKPFVEVLRTVEQGELAVRDRVRATIRDEITRHQLSEVVRSTDRELTYSLRFELPDSQLLNVDEADGNEAAITNPAQPGADERVTIGREQIVQKIKDNVSRRLQGEEEGEINRGIELVDVGISNIGFVPTVREMAFERLKAFMESIAAGYYNAGVQRKQEILNATNAEVEKILGEGEREAQKTRGKVDAELITKYANAIEETGDLYNFEKTLEVYKKALNGQSRLILTTDSELFRLLKSVHDVDPPPPSTPDVAEDNAEDAADAVTD